MDIWPNDVEARVYKRNGETVQRGAGQCQRGEIVGMDNLQAQSIRHMLSTEEESSQTSLTISLKMSSGRSSNCKGLSFSTVAVHSFSLPLSNFLTMTCGLDSSLGPIFWQDEFWDVGGKAGFSWS